MTHELTRRRVMGLGALLFVIGFAGLALEAWLLVLGTISLDEANFVFAPAFNISPALGSATILAG